MIKEQSNFVLVSDEDALVQRLCLPPALNSNNISFL